MKKLIVPFLFMLILMISGCNTNDSTKDKKDTSAKEKKSDTITYQSENGPVIVPADPQRVVVLNSYAGNVLALDVNIIGVDSWSKMNPSFQEKLVDSAEVTEDDLEKIIELDPDLIIGLSSLKNIEKLTEIAPTVTFTWGKVDYLTQQLEIGKLLNKEKEAQAWIDDFKQRAAATGEEIKAKIGQDATVSVIENYDKQLYVFGENLGRGTELLYEEMKLNIPEKIKEDTSEEGYFALSLEVLPEYAGDYIILNKYSEQDNSFQDTETYKNIPAIKNKRIYEVNALEFNFTDPLTLELQLDFFKKSFLGK